MILEVVTSLFLVWLLWFLLTTYQERRNAPPGPFPLPFIGNVHQLGSSPPFTMEKLFEKYGDVYQVRLPLGTFIVLNSAEVLIDAVKNKRDDFAGKPSSFFYPLNKIADEKNIASENIGPKLILRRKLFKIAMHSVSEGMDKIEERIAGSVRKFLTKIEAMDGEAFYIRDFFTRAIVCHVWELMTSKKCDLDDKMVTLILDFHENIERLIREGIVYQILPFLKYLPTKFMKSLKETMDMRDTILESELKEHISSYTGSVRDLTDGLIFAYKKEESKNSLKEIGTIDDLKFLMVDMLGSGFGSKTVVDWSIFVIASNIDLQVKIQNELDKVVGRDRLPRLEDLKHLHNLQATVCEVMRHSVFLPMIYRKTIRDTSIKGYMIPKNTPVILNMYQAQKNSKEWDEPDQFKPDRFIDEQGHFLGWTGIKAFFLPFGYGHRMCLGEELGKELVFSMLSGLLHQFALELPKDESKLNTGTEERRFLHLAKEYKVIARKRP